MKALHFYSIVFGFSIFIFILGCQESKPSAQTISSDKAVLDTYWYQGKAEVNSYDLQQERYGTIRPGHAILIFVTEDFLTDKQVKNESYTDKQSTLVLKHNLIRRFTTGLYDYSLMSSVFSPLYNISKPNALKITTTLQDWCGTSSVQLNKRDEKWKVSLRSYFEKENDQDFNIDNVYTEDELLNLIRIAPGKLPIGNIEVLPMLQSALMLHWPITANQVKASLKDYKGTDFKAKNLRVYTLEFMAINRSVSYIFERESPYKIVGWTETYNGKDGKVLTTKATIHNSSLEAYWTENKPGNEKMRAPFGIENGY
ncbi:MAG TPA: hypothetical protein VK590_08665 [Saprospiraceae bacterium]|nr:hypothetical protein [Saprospiraceae bacterium]